MQVDEDPGFEAYGHDTSVARRSDEASLLSHRRDGPPQSPRRPVHRAPRLLQSDRDGRRARARDQPRAHGILARERGAGVRARGSADQAVSEVCGEARGRLTPAGAPGNRCQTPFSRREMVSDTDFRTRRVPVGRVSGLFGVKGWLKIHSYTEPRENVVGFKEWILEHDGVLHRVEVEAGKPAGKHVIAKLRGVDDRDEARRWIGAEISVERSALPPCEPGE